MGQRGAEGIAVRVNEGELRLWYKRKYKRDRKSGG